MRVRLNRTNIKALEPRPARYEVADADTPALRVRVTPNGVKTFVLGYRNQTGKQCRFTIGRFGDLTPEQARIVAQTKLAEIALGGDPCAERAATREAAKEEQRREEDNLAPSEPLTFGAFLRERYGPWVIANRKSGAETLAMLEGRFASLLAVPLEGITHAMVEDWRTQRKTAGTSPVTINRNLVALKASLARAVDWGILPAHPLPRLKLDRIDTSGRVRFLSTAEEAGLRQALSARDSRLIARRDSHNRWLSARGRPERPALGRYGDHLTPAVLLSLNTGVRRGELLALHWRDVDFELRMLTVGGETAKSGQTRHLPLNAEALDVLQTWREQNPKNHGPVFPATTNGDGETVEALRNLRRAFGGVLRNAQIENFSWHCLRHSFASKLVMRGVDLMTVKELLGHRDMRMVTLYAHLSPEHRAAAVARLL
jgi:integrase